MVISCLCREGSINPQVCDMVREIADMYIYIYTYPRRQEAISNEVVRVKDISQTYMCIYIYILYNTIKCVVWIYQYIDIFNVNCLWKVWSVNPPVRYVIDMWILGQTPPKHWTQILPIAFGDFRPLHPNPKAPWVVLEGVSDVYGFLWKHGTSNSTGHWFSSVSHWDSYSIIFHIFPSRQMH